MSDRFKDLIGDAARQGMMSICRAKLETVARSANWYAENTADRVDAKTFDGLRADIDAAEALWDSAQRSAAQRQGNDHG